MVDCRDIEFTFVTGETTSNSWVMAANDSSPTLIYMPASTETLQRWVVHAGILC